jgi:hypothetical protein
MTNVTVQNSQNSTEPSVNLSPTIRADRPLRPGVYIMEKEFSSKLPTNNVRRTLGSDYRILLVLGSNNRCLYRLLPIRRTHIHMHVLCKYAKKYHSDGSKSGFHSTFTTGPRAFSDDLIRR